MKKQLAAAVLSAVLLAGALAGCAGNKAQEAADEPAGWTPVGETESSGEEAAPVPAETPAVPEKMPENPAETAEPAEEAVQPAGTAESAAFSFADLRNVEFLFSSGVGGWYTEMKIAADGSFTGHYQDSDMGDVAEGAPNGTLYWCDFYGWFSEPEQVDAHTFRMTAQDVECGTPTGEEEIKDGFRYVYSEPYGMEDAETVYLYLPDTPVAGLPEAFLSWVRMAIPEGSDVLGFYGLFNEKAGNGFSGYAPAVTASSLADSLAETEKRDAELEAVLDSDISQTEMNLAAGERYEIWDGLLNDIWGYLRETLPDSEMQALTAQEQNWIREKEKAVQDAAAEYEGGSIVPLVTGNTGADWTKKRVYALMEYVH